MNTPAFQPALSNRYSDRQPARQRVNVSSPTHSSTVLLLKPGSIDPSYVYAKISIQCSLTNMLHPPLRLRKSSLVCSDDRQASYHIPLMKACGKACGKKNVQATGLPLNLTQQYYLVSLRTWRGRKKSAKGGRARTYCASVRSRM